MAVFTQAIPAGCRLGVTTWACTISFLGVWSANSICGLSCVTISFPSTTCPTIQEEGLEAGGPQAQKPTAAEEN
jgi:hypothetical protein